MAEVTIDDLKEHFRQYEKDADDVIWNLIRSSEVLLEPFNVKMTYISRELDTPLVACVFFTDDDMWMAEGYLRKEGFIVESVKNEIWIRGIKE